MGKFWIAFAIGVAAGAAVALVYAPQSGARTRRQLRRGIADAGDYLNDTASNLSDTADKYLKRGKSAMNEVVDSAQNVATAAKRMVSFS